MKRSANTPKSIDSEAAAWFVQLSSDDGEPQNVRLQSQFLTWLRQSPAHLKSFLDIAEIDWRLTGIDPRRCIEIPDRSHVRSNVAIAVHAGQPRNSAVEGKRPWPQPRVGIAACIIAMIALVLICGDRSRNVTYATGIGEERRISLMDGSILHLNTRSHVIVTVAERGTRVRLIEGEAFFTVRHDALRSFRVDAGDATIQALGTQFDVYVGERSTTVSVIDGAVNLTVGRRAGTAAALAATDLAAGEEARVSDATFSKRTLEHVADAIAWREHRLVFRNTALAEVAVQFNRYNTLQMRVDGAAARSKQLTGIFRADRPLSLALFLANDDSLSLERLGAQLVIRTRVSQETRHD